MPPKKRTRQTPSDKPYSKTTIGFNREEEPEKPESIPPDGETVLEDSDRSDLGFMEDGNNYVFVSIKEKDGEYKKVKFKVSNFIIRMVALIISEENPRRIAILISDDGETEPFEISVDDFSSASSFRKVVEARGNFLFKGTNFHILALKELLFKDAKPFIESLQLGFWPKYDSYFFSNGVLTESKFYPVDDFGLCKTDKHAFFIPAFSSIYKDRSAVYKEYQKFILKPCSFQFSEYSKLFLKVYGRNGYFGLAFWISSLFYDIIFSKIDAFPILFLFGPPQSGKGAFATSLLSFFGTAQEPIQLGSYSTGKGLMRKFSQLRNSIIWLDEYKNSIPKEIIAVIKGLFDGQGYERAAKTTGFETITNPILSSAMIAGQELPTIEPAMLSRMLLLNFKVENINQEKSQMFSALKDIEKDGISGITAEVWKHRSLINKQFDKVYSETQDRLRKLSYEKDMKPNTRMIMSYSSVFTPLFILSRKENNLNFEMGMSEEDIIHMIHFSMEEQEKVQGENNDLTVFWDIVGNLLQKNLIKYDEHITYYSQEKALVLNFTAVHQAYYEQCQKVTGRIGLDKSSLSGYLKLEPYFLRMGSHRYGKGDNVKVSHSYFLDYSRMTTKILDNYKKDKELDQVTAPF